MDRVINIDINDIHDLYEPYNDNYLHKDLIDYLIRQSTSFKKDDQIIIEIDNNATKDRNFETIMKQSLKKERERLEAKYKDMNKKQFIWFITGIIVIMLSFIIKENNALQEILIVVGSVPIWEAISNELFKDTDVRKKMHVIDLLLKSMIRTI